MAELESPTTLNEEQRESPAETVVVQPPLQDLLLNTFLGSQENSEREAKTIFNSVVFGHSFRDFDLDQLFAYYFALKLGLVSPAAAVTFTSNIHAPGPNGTSYFDDPKVLVIEGFGHTPEDDNTLVKDKRYNGNFANGLKGEPAASEVIQQFSQRYGTHSDKKELKALRAWITAVETGSDELKGEVDGLSVATIDLIKKIFYGLKKQYSKYSEENQQSLVVDSVVALEKILRKTSFDDLSTEYADVIALSKQSEKDNTNKLAEKVRSPETFKQITSLSGVSLTFFDIRGTGITHGATDRARSKGKPDILILVDDHFDDTGESIIGTEYKIFVENESNTDLLAVLADRMQMAEAQFGKGYTYSEISSFGSHAGIVASPQSEGSSIDTTALWRALQNFFDYPRYSVADFKTKASEIAAKLDTEQYTVIPVTPSETNYHFGTRAIMFTLKTDHGLATVQLSEEDLPFYEPLFTNDPAQNTRLLLERTSISEPAAVIEARATQFETWTDKYLEAKNAPRLLELLATVNENTITALPIDKKIAILATIAANPETIRHIWDKNDLTYAVIDARLPEEILPYTEEYKLNRYKLKSLAHSIDTTLVSRTISEVIRSKNNDDQQRLAETLLTVLTSETFTQSHTKEVYDSLLPSLLFFAAELVFTNKDLAQSIISTIEEKYGESMQSHWDQVDPSYRDLLAKNFPDSILIELIPESQTETVPGLAGSKMEQFSVETSLERIMESGNKTLTFLVEVTRPIKAKVMREESTFATSSGKKAPLKALDAYFSTGSFNLENAEHMKLVKSLLDSMRSALAEIILDDEETKLRIIQGGFINRLTGQVQDYISDMLFKLIEEKNPEAKSAENRAKVQKVKKNQLLWSNYNSKTDSYVDSPFVEELPT